MSRLNPAPDLSQARLRTGAGQGAATTPTAGRPRSDSNASASSSSTDTSEEEERQRQEYLGEYGGPPSVTKPTASAVWVIVMLLLCQAAGLWLFTRGFLLTRVTLDGKAKCDRPATSSWTPSPPEGVSEAALTAWDTSLEDAAECTLPPAYSRSLVFIIDALRYDFIAPVSSSGNFTPDVNYHSVLTLPSRLDAQVKANPRAGATSFLSHFLADAPTTTLQRLKGLTTGTLPTFIDAGSNFAGSEIDEDSWLGQLRARGDARLGFMGDDTWLSTFPNMFDRNWTWPYDSFNVEDLDTVDRGVEASLLPFLDAKAKDRPADADSWSLLVAHTLGVDHVGHRFGASHPRMRTKLEEMERLLTDVVDKLPDDALFVLLGDHGMDERGDHGGDGELEVGAALWVYAKRGAAGKDAEAHLAEVVTLSHVELPSHRSFSPLPAPHFAPHRSVPQIDLVPTLSLLLGVPIPFNNLGTIIPELFPPVAGGKDRYLRALRINARQIRTYLRSYAAKSDDLAPFEAELRGLWLDALKADAAFVAASSEGKADAARQAAAQAYIAYTRGSLLRAQSVWAQFEGTRMALGIALLFLSVLTTVALRQGALHGMITGWGTREDGMAPKVPGRRGARLRIRRRTFAKRTDGIEAVAGFVTKRMQSGALVGAAVGLGTWALRFVLPGGGLPFTSGLDWSDLGAAGASLGAQSSLLLSQHHFFTSPSLPAGGVLSGVNLRDIIAVLLPLVHAAGFGSVAFVIWEDFAVATLLVSILGLRALLGFLYAPTKRLQRRTSFLGVAAGVALRLAAFVHVCREEQAPKCRSTFYAGGQLGAALNSPYAVAVAYVVALVVPSVIGWVLSQSKANAGVAPMYLTWILRPTLLMGAGYWLADWASPRQDLSASTRALLETVKLGVARADLALICVIGGAFWLFAPLCLEMRREQVEPTPAQLAAERAAANGLQQQPVGEAAPPQRMTRVVILGFANSMGSSYLLLVGLVFSLLFLLAQPMGQIALALAFLSIVALAEMGDCERDAALLRAALVASGRKRNDQQQQEVKPPKTSAESFAAASAAAASSGLPSGTTPPPIQPPSLLETSTLALLGFVTFFATGHQATLPSIQWRTAFVGFRNVSYPLSPLFVALNAFGPLVLLPAISVPLLVLWNVAPRPRQGPGGAGARQKPTKMPTASHLLSTSLSFLLYHTITTLGSALFAAWFRRHLMLFKLWTPRFMLGGVSLLGAHVGTIIGTAASAVVLSKVATTFGSAF